jgi:type II secretory pathway pseudopilin PulG
MTTRVRVAGFSLTEAMVVVVLVLMIGGGFLVMLMSQQRASSMADNSVQLQQEARRALDTITGDLREANPAAITCGPGAAACGGANDTRLNFQVARSYDAGTGTRIWGGDATDTWFLHYAIISPTPTTVQLIRYNTNAAGGATVGSCTPTPPGRCRVLANNVNAVQVDFAWDAAAGVVTVALATRMQSSAIPGGQQSSGVVRSRIRLRNQ